MQEQYHIPVLLDEVIDGLNIQPGGVYVDCTFGGGGPFKAILQKLGATGKLIAFDQDDDAKEIWRMTSGSFLFAKFSSPATISSPAQY